MYKVDHGIDVFYINKKGSANIVYFQNGAVKEYAPGEMLLELVSEDGKFMMTTKVENMARMCFHRDDPFDIEGITNTYRFMWEAVADDDFPVVTEIFRSFFSWVIHNNLENINGIDSFKTAGEFLDLCYETYFRMIEEFYDCVDALASVESISQDRQHNDMQYERERKIASDFVSKTALFGIMYKKSCHEEGNCQYTRQINSPMGLLIFEYWRKKKKKRALKICQNCCRYFIPRNRTSTTIFCENSDPEMPEKTCKETGPWKKIARERRKDEEWNKKYIELHSLYNQKRREYYRDSSLLLPSIEKSISECLTDYKVVNKHNKERGKSNG